MNTSAFDDFARGGWVLIHDHEREREADLCCLAEFITPEKINFLLHKARGLICVACDPGLLDRLKIPLMCANNQNPHGTNFCVSVDLATGVTTGVSAFDRASVIKHMANPLAQATDFVQPGHTFPLKALHPDERFGHTEATVSLAHIVGKTPAVVICEVLNETGHKASFTEVLTLGEIYNIPVLDLKTLHSWIQSSLKQLKAV